MKLRIVLQSWGDMYMCGISKFLKLVFSQQQVEFSK